MHRSILGLVAAISLFCASSVHAESTLEIFVGGAFTEFDVSGFGSGSGDDSISVGLRGTSWLESVEWLGFSGGFSFFQPVSSSQADLYVVPITLQLALRLPLAKSDAFPHGRIQPYVAGGGGAFFTFADTSIGDDAEVDVGADVRVGIDLLATSVLSLFIEYRYTYYEIDPIEVETNYVQGGIGLHF